MEFGVKNKRQVFLRVVFGSQVAFFFWTIWCDAIARVVDPANDVIEVCLLADALEVCSKMPADRVFGVANRVTGHTTTSFKQLFSVSGVAAWLSWQRVRETVLPEICGDGLDLI